MADNCLQRDVNGGRIVRKRRTLVECESCMGYGQLNVNGQPSMDRRDRPCGDCRGTGSVPLQLTRKPR